MGGGEAAAESEKSGSAQEGRKLDSLCGFVSRWRPEHDDLCFWKCVKRDKEKRIGAEKGVEPVKGGVSFRTSGCTTGVTFCW